MERAKRRVAKHVRSLLAQSRREIIDALSRAPKDWQAAQLRLVLREVERSLNAFATTAQRAAVQGSDEMARLGIDLARSVLEEPGASLSASPIIHSNDVVAAFDTLPDQITDVSREAINRVSNVLRRSVLGQLSPFDAMKLLPPITGSGPFRSAAYRAELIIRTEYHRISQIASQATINAAAVRTPGLSKRWVTTHDGRTRPAHGRADGQIVDYDKSFLVGGQSLRFPGDPRGRPDNTINCRCVVVPHRAGWHKA